MAMIKDKKVFGWTMYDWANSSFATTVMAGFFPVFFKSYWSAGADVNQSTALLGMANSIASLIVALLAPILGAIADQGTAKKKFLIFFAYLGALLSGCLYMVKAGQWGLAILFYVIGTVGFSGANTFYDALLPDVTTEKKIDYVSAKGYALGYLGGGLLFLINVLWYLMPATFGLPVEKSASPHTPLTQTATVIQLDQANGFEIPARAEIGKAVVTSRLEVPFRIVEIEPGRYPNYATIELDFDLPIDPGLVAETVDFGEYRRGEITRFDYTARILEIHNLTRNIKNESTVTLILNNPITYQEFSNSELRGVAGLANHFGAIQIKTDFLPPAIEFLSIRLSFLSVALWWGLFTIPLIAYVKERKVSRPPRQKMGYIKMGFSQLIHTFRKIRHMKIVFTFLIAYWLYIDGVDTIIRMAVDYGMSIGFPSSSLILALMITQFVGFPAALVFGYLGERWDVKKSIYITIAVYLVVTGWGIMMTKAIEFYIMAVIIGLVQGGIQALSRSYYSRLIPCDQTGEFYGFYNMLGKFAAIVGPGLIGIVGLLVRNAGYSANIASRAGIGSVSILFVTGGILLWFVDEKKGKEEASHLRLE